MVGGLWPGKYSGAAPSSFPGSNKGDEGARLLCFSQVVRSSFLLLSKQLKSRQAIPPRGQILPRGREETTVPLRGTLRARRQQPVRRQERPSSRAPSQVRISQECSN